MSSTENEMYIIRTGCHIFLSRLLWERIFNRSNFSNYKHLRQMCLPSILRRYGEKSSVKINMSVKHECHYKKAINIKKRELRKQLVQIHYLSESYYFIYLKNECTPYITTIAGEINTQQHHTPIRFRHSYVIYLLTHTSVTETKDNDSMTIFL